MFVLKGSDDESTVDEAKYMNSSDVTGERGRYFSVGTGFIQQT